MANSKSLVSKSTQGLNPTHAEMALFTIPEGLNGSTSDGINEADTFHPKGGKAPHFANPQLPKW
jgi:hypothetical protein